MNKIEIDNNKILNTFNSTGKESIIYYYNDINTLLKYFRDTITEDQIKEYYLQKSDYSNYTINSGLIISDEKLENKRKKIELINNIECLKNEIEILDLAFKNNVFKGYTMKKENMKPIDIFSNKRKKIKLLKLIKEKIILLNNSGIYIGDFNLNNFLTNNNATILKICDLDNLRINELDFDTKHSFVQLFEKKCNIKEYIDSYCFNLFTISFLNTIVNDIYYINKSKIPSILNTKENHKIIESMKHLDNSYKYKFLIDNLK